MRNRLYFILILNCLGLIILFSCKDNRWIDYKLKRQNYSYANLDSIQYKHLNLNLIVDFSTKKLKGKVSYQIKNKGKLAILDIKDLNIINVKVDDEKVHYQLYKSEDENDKKYGEALLIPIAHNGTHQLVIEYETSPQAKALNWLNEVQTYDKKDPFLYTENNCIQTRTWIPIPDNSAVRIPYNAQIKAKPGLVALMPFDTKSVSEKEVDSYKFEMKKPISPHNINLIVGNLASFSYNDSVTIYAEPSKLNAAVKKYETVKTTLNIAKQKWGDCPFPYTSLVLMPIAYNQEERAYPSLFLVQDLLHFNNENINLLLSKLLGKTYGGLRMGNKTWTDTWISEGISTYISRKIIEEQSGIQALTLAEYQGKLNYNQTIEDFIKNNRYFDLALFQMLDNRYPDLATNDITQEKTYLFCKMLEEYYGEETLINFLNNLYKTYEFQNISTKDFIQFCNKNLVMDDKSVGLNLWIYEPDEPFNIPSLKPAHFETYPNPFKVTVEMTEKWSYLEWLYFINTLNLTTSELQKIDKKLQISKNHDPDVMYAWTTKCLKNNYTGNLAEVKQFLTQNSNTIYLQVLYYTLIQNGYATEAKAFYEEARPSYHTKTKEKIDKLIKLE